MAFAHCPIEHPVTGERFEVNAPLPDDLPDLHVLLEFGSAGEHPLPVQITAGDSASSQETQA